MIKIQKKTFFTIIIVGVISLFSITTFAQSKDLLEQAFEKSMEQEQIVDIWNTKNAVGNEVFQESISATYSIEKWFNAERKEWLLMNFIRLLMRIAIIIAIPMIIINAIILIISVSSGALTNALKMISYITLWIVIILSSIAIVYLVLSATSWTIVPKLQNL